jgi:hypothetical protein
MSQNDLVIANQSFPSFRTDLNSALQAINTTHSGTSLPSGAVAGTIWLDTTSATSPTLKIYDGTDSISLAIIDYTTNTVDWLDSSLSYNSTATSAGTLTLTVSSSYKQYFTGTTTHTVTLPVASTLTVGQTFEIHNNSTGSITVNSSGANLVGTVQANVTAQCTCILASGTTAASWDFDITGFSSAVPTTRGGTGLTSIGSSLQVLRVNSGATALEFATAGSATPFAVTGDATSGSEIRLPEDTDNGSNYVALKAANSIASNLTLTLPSADGTSGQVLQTNGSGVLSFAGVSASAGQVIQVVSTAKTDTFAISTGDTFTDITGLSVSITPSSASNKILVMYNVSIGTNSGSGYGYAKLLRGSTGIFIGDSSGSRISISSGGASSNINTTLKHSIQFLDSPSTTSSTTYKVQGFAQAGTGIIYINRSYGDDNANTGVRDVSSITVMEIKG